MDKKPNKKYTIYDIAEMAGVSSATISRVINKSPSVDYETRHRVLEIFDRINYRPKVIRNKVPNIGVIVDAEDFGYRFFSDYTAGLVEGVNEYTYKHSLGMSMVILESLRLNYPEDIASFLMEKDISGAIFINPPEDADYIYALDKLGFPYAIIGSNFSRGKINSFDVDNEDGTRKALQYLIGLGHQKIGFVGTESRQYAFKQRFCTYSTTLTDSGLDCIDDFVQPSAVDSRMGMGAGYSIIMGKKKNIHAFPTAFICLNDDIAVGVIKALNELGMRVPEDLSIIGFDDYPKSEYFTPALTTVQSPLREIGFAACEHVEKWLKGRKDRVQKLFSAELAIRSSCAAPVHIDQAARK